MDPHAGTGEPSSQDSTALARRLLDPVPVHRTFGLEVVRADAEGSEVAITTTEALSNVVGALHASGLATLVDAAGLAAIIGLARGAAEMEGVLPLGATAELRFLAAARGRLTARCTPSVPARTAVRSVLGGEVRTAHLETTTVIRDAAGTTVCEGTFAWSLRRAPRT